MKKESHALFCYLVRELGPYTTCISNKLSEGSRILFRMPFPEYNYKSKLTSPIVEYEGIPGFPAVLYEGVSTSDYMCFITGYRGIIKVIDEGKISFQQTDNLKYVIPADDFCEKLTEGTILGEFLLNSDDETQYIFYDYIENPSKVIEIFKPRINKSLEECTRQDRYITIQDEYGVELI